MRNLFLDMDGVLADFDSHYPAVFGHDHRTTDMDIMWDNINNHPTFFFDIPPFEGTVKFYDELRDLKPIILTACPKTNYQQVAKQKRDWIRHHLDPDAWVFPVMGGHNKCLFMHKEGDILVDDHQKNLKPWTMAGGISILHTHFDITLNRIGEIFRHDAR